ncbi:MAG: hypothetical protein A2091_10980 [Desulfuromonadales bacterium GWD2_61_12]|nr:MAG: hypothetical protein A2005_10660 [Desulfuromonadales bacterium GWC2_61_20]OGR35183.1 MAG: hypothetical protein A2091_10980 [Desulfuromonadales bacterium GWD2_61_12]HBT83505.1 hypothetical protein [Desulfuromonas sp.]
MSIRQPGSFSGLSLRSKILFPFFVILVILGLVASVGSLALIRSALLQTVDDRLLAYQDVVYREIKQQEILLSTYATNLQYLEAAGAAGSPELLVLRDELYASLAQAQISVTLFPPGYQRQITSSTLRALLDQAVSSGKPRFRFTADSGPNPALCIAAPLSRKGQLRGILLLQSPMDPAFLRQLGRPFEAETFLLSLSGETLSASNAELNPPELNGAEMAAVISGDRLFKDLGETPPHRHLIQAIALGTTDMVLVSSELPTRHLDLLVTTLATRAGLTIFLALVLGSLVYYRIIRQIMAPLKELLAATRAVSGGDLHYRVRTDGHGELGRLGAAFNAMLEQLGGLYEERVAREKVQVASEDEVRFRGILEQKNLEIERTNRELKAHLRELSALFQINQSMITTLDLQVLFDRTLNTLRDLLLCREMVLLLYQPGSEELVVHKSIGIDAEVLKGMHFTFTEGITGLAARTRELQYVRDVGKESRYIHYKSRMVGTGSMVSMPLTFKQGLVGVLNLHKERPGAFTDSELKIIQSAGNQLAIAIENTQLYEKTRALSNTDELTGLANRRYFHEILKRELTQSGRYQSSFSIIMIDIDFFKEFNDTHGHLNGDVALRKVAALMLQNTRGIDLVARFGGEEFIILLPKTVREGAHAAAEKLRLCVAAEAIPLAGGVENVTNLTISLGLAEFPGDCKDIYELIDLADRALYLAKERGRNRTVVWSNDLAHPSLSGGRARHNLLTD